MKKSTLVALLVALTAAVSMHVIVSAQNVTMQNVIGQNVSIVAGIKDQFIGDMFKQRQNEAVSCIFAVNPDQQMFAYNDYRTVDEPLDGQIGTPAPLQRSLFAKLLNPFRKSRQPRVAAAEEASALAWIGLSFTDNGTDYYTGLHPASPFSPAVAGDTQLAAYQFQAASDPVFAATPTHCLMAGIAFTPGGLSAGFVSRFTSTNNQERKSNAHFDFSKVVTTSPIKSGLTSDFFVDKPFIAASANGKVVVAYVIFDESDPTKLSSKIIVFTSNDYGETWPTPGVVVSQPLTRNQSPWILIDPNNDANVYIGWRVFSNPKFPTLTNAIVGKRSSNGGATFDPIVPYPVALLLRAYDAPQTEYPAARITPRSSAYPSAVIDSHGTISVFIQEYVGANGFPLSPFASLANGKARITQTNSYDRGVSWTLRRAFDYGPESGPQFMPAAAVTGVPGPVCPGKTGPRSRIAVLYYDARPSYPNGSVFLGGSGARFDVRVAESDPCATDSGRRPIFDRSQQVSQYTVDGTPAHAIVKTPGFGYPAVNAPYRIFNATKSYFTGDYIHITPKVAYVLSGTPPTWKATIAASVNPGDLPAPVFKTVWADSRDLILPTSPAVPAQGTPGFLDLLPWDTYRPPHSGLNPIACDNPASRDQNPYAAEISDGLYAAAPVTFRESTGPRAFPVYVENRTAIKRFFRLSIDPTVAVQASFNLPAATGPFVPKKTSDVAIGTFSSVTGSVIVAAGFTAPVRITIQEIVAVGGALVSPNGLSTLLTLNTGGEPTGEGQAESRAPGLDPTPIVTKPFGTISASGIVIGPNGPNPYVNPFGDNPFGDNPFGDNPFGDNPFGDNTTVFDVTDVTFTSSSAGTKAASYSAILNVAGFTNLNISDYKFQALINRPSPVPGLNGCQTIEKQQPIQISNLKQPFGDNPFGDNPFGDNPFGDNPFGDNAAPNENVSNSTFYLAPPAVADVSFRDSRPQDRNLYTLRVFQLVPSPLIRFTPAAVKLTVTAHEPDVVQQPGGGFDFQRDPAGRPVRGVSAAGAGIPNKLRFIVQPTNTTVSQFITPAVRVQVLDVFDNPVTTATTPVTLGIGSNPGEGTLSGTKTRNAVEGVATFSDLSINSAGEGYTLTASATGPAGDTSTSFNIVPGQILIFGPSLNATGTPNEKTIAESLGYAVTVASTGTWSSMTTAQFAAFKAIVFGDPDCSTNPAVLGTASSTSSNWVPAVLGPKVVVGTDTQHHGVSLGENGHDATAVAQQVTRNAISFAASQSGATGMYMSLSCYYAFATTTAVDALGGFGSFLTRGSNDPLLANFVTVNDASHPVLAGIIEADLNNWGKSLHETINSMPSTWKVIASQSANPTLVSPAQPYIIAENRGVRGTVTNVSGAVLPGVSVTATGAGGAFSMLTDETGKYAFIGIPAGTYTLSVAAGGFVPQNPGIEVPPYAMLVKNITLSSSIVLP